MKQSVFEDPHLVSSVKAILKDEFLRESNVLNLLPSAVYVCNLSGTIYSYNRKAVELWGRTPRVNDTDEKFCGAFKLYYPDGSPMSHHETPVASTLRDGQPRENLEVIIERPDLSRIHVMVNIVPIHDDEANLIGMVNCFHDITAQKTAEKELEWKTLQLEDYVDNASIGLHWVNADGIVLWANKAELDMLGYSKEEYIGHHISKFHVDQQKISDILNRLSCNETLKQYEAELICKDGSTKTVHISSNVFTHEGKFVHTRCFTVDVSEQKKLMDALKESEEKYKQLIEQIAAPIYATDADGVITLYNQAAADFWGREPVIGVDKWCGSYRILNPDGTEMPVEDCPMGISLKEQRPVFGREIIVGRPDGSIRYAKPYPKPVFDSKGKMTGAINMLVDITGLKETERALRNSETKYRELTTQLEKKIEEKTSDLKKVNEEIKNSEERYHKMVEEVEDYAIILLNRDGIIQNWNKGAEKIKGYKESEIIGKSFEIFYREEDRKSGLPYRLINQAAEKGKAIHEGWRVRKDGTTFWGSTVLTALHDNENHIIGFSKVTRDLTQRKLSEDKLRDYTNQLEFQNKELEQFAYAASHDMKEPLRKIHFYNSYIAENLDEKTDNKIKDYLERSIKSVRRMSNLIEDLLTYARTTSNDQNFEEVNLNEIVDEIMLHQKEEFDQKMIRFEVGNLGSIKGIGFQLKQLLENMIGNAIKYRHPDRSLKVKISGEVVKGPLPLLDADNSKKYYHLVVEDNGIGFEPQYAEKIFELFQRLDNLPTAKGSGIGLAICKRIIQNHHGFIKASGSEDEGARFDMYFPMR